MSAARILALAVLLPLHASAAAQESPAAAPAIAPATPNAAAAPQWPAWAARMSKAQQSLNYDATLVIDHGRDWELVEVTQRIGPHGPEQQVVALNGERRRYVHTAQGMSLLGPEGDLRLGQGPGLPASVQAESLEGTYRITLGGRDRIAGRAAVQMRIEPLSNDRFGLRLWLDADTGLPLRSERIGADGGVLERRMVTRLNVHGFAGRAAGATRRITRVSATIALPAGFNQVGEPIAVPGIDGARQWILSDGLAWVSVYRLPMQPGLAPLTRSWRHGAMGQIAINANDAWIYVLGDAPNATLEQLGAAVLAGQR